MTTARCGSPRFHLYNKSLPNLMFQYRDVHENQNQWQEHVRDTLNSGPIPKMDNQVTFL